MKLIHFYKILATVFIIIGVVLFYFLVLNTNADNKHTKKILNESVLETIAEETVVDKNVQETESDENGSCTGAYVEYGQEYLGNWYSEDGHINFTVDKLFTAAGNGYTPGEYAVNNNTYDVIVDIVPYHTENKYDGYMGICIKIPVDPITMDSEPIICGKYKLSSDEDTLTVTVIEPDIDGLPPTYENTRSIYHIGDVVVFNKQ